MNKLSSAKRAPVVAALVEGNFARWRVTPATEAGVAMHVWGIDEIIGLVEMAEQETAA